MASDAPWARRRSIPLDEIRHRTLVVDRRTGTTTAHLWPDAERPALVHTHDIGDWLAAIATGRYLGVTPTPPPPSTAATASPTAPSATAPPSPSTSSGAATTPTQPPTQPPPSSPTSTPDTPDPGWTHSLTHRPEPSATELCETGRKSDPAKRLCGERPGCGARAVAQLRSAQGAWAQRLRPCDSGLRANRAASVRPYGLPVVQCAPTKRGERATPAERLRAGGQDAGTTRTVARLRSAQGAWLSACGRVIQACGRTVQRLAVHASPRRCRTSLRKGKRVALAKRLRPEA